MKIKLFKPCKTRNILKVYHVIYVMIIPVPPLVTLGDTNTSVPPPSSSWQWHNLFIVYLYFAIGVTICHNCHSFVWHHFRNDFNPMSDVKRRFKIANSEWKIKLTWKTDFFNIKCLLLFFHRFQSPFGYFQTFIVGKQKRQFLSKKLKYV